MPTPEFLIGKPPVLTAGGFFRAEKLMPKVFPATGNVWMRAGENVSSFQNRTIKIDIFVHLSYADFRR
jgi:hypothetical protein